jgi:hypothetical protein
MQTQLHRLVSHNHLASQPSLQIYSHVIREPHIKLLHQKTKPACTPTLIKEKTRNILLFFHPITKAVMQINRPPWLPNGLLLFSFPFIMAII